MHCTFLQEGSTALYCAVAKGHIDVVKLLLSRFPNIITQIDSVSE